MFMHIILAYITVYIIDYQENFRLQRLVTYNPTIILRPNTLICCDVLLDYSPLKHKRISAPWNKASNVALDPVTGTIPDYSVHVHANMPNLSRRNPHEIFHDPVIFMFLI